MPISDNIVSDRSLHFSDEFVISCGTVTIDVNVSKALLIRSRRNNEFYLPKGRKNIGESLEAAAIRETYEETGFPIKLRPTHSPTRQTMARVEAQKISSNTVEVHTEAIAVQQRTYRGTSKIIFWYIGDADSTQTPDQGTQDDTEDFEATWVSFGEMETTLTFEDDKMIARRAFGIAMKPFKSDIIQKA